MDKVLKLTLAAFAIAGFFLVVGIQAGLSACNDYKASEASRFVPALPPSSFNVSEFWLSAEGNVDNGSLRPE